VKQGDSSRRVESVPFKPWVAVLDARRAYGVGRLAVGSAARVRRAWRVPSGPDVVWGITRQEPRPER